MLRLLLDNDISPKVAREVLRHLPDCPIQAVRDWRGGIFADEEDDIILAHAQVESLTLLTRDASTIKPLVDAWGQQGRSHAGVIFVDDRTIPEGNVGALVRAIVAFWPSHREDELADTWLYLPSAPAEFRL